MALELTVNNVDEFQEMVDSKDFKISESIVNSILSNLNSKKNHIHILSVSILEDGQTLDLTLERKFFIETLEENIKYFIEQERYEDCQKIVEAIDKLKIKEKKTSKTLTKLHSVLEKEVKHKRVITSTHQDQNVIEVKADKTYMKSKKNQQAITAMETFMSLPDELLIEMIYKDPEGINVICLALGIELNNIKYAKKSKIGLDI